MSDTSGSSPLSPDRPAADRDFHVDAPFDPAGDQPDAIEQLVEGYVSGMTKQTLLGVTGSGKTNTVSWTVEELQQPTLVIAHNKTLAAQLYEEFRNLFPDNAVEYFVSYYDYYQPEAYVEQTDTYIDKDMSINEEIDRLRHSATRSLLTRDDVIVVASVSAIYGLGDPTNYTEMALRVELGDRIDRDELLAQLVDLNYERNDVDFQQGTFRVRGDTVEVYPMYGRYAARIEFWGDEVDRMTKLDPLTGEVVSEEPAVLIHPAEHYSIPEEKLEAAIDEIEALMEDRVKYFERQGDLVAAQRIEERTTFDIEMLRETGYCSGIENYSVHMSDRDTGEAPYTGTLQLHGCARFEDAEYYRLLYAYEGADPVPFTGLTWNAPRIGSPPLHVSPDPQGWYRIRDPSDLVFPYWLLNWNTRRYPDGRYEVRLQLGDGSKNVVDESGDVAFVVDNSRPTATFTRLRWRKASESSWIELSSVCPVVRRPPGEPIEIEVSYTVSARHFRDVRADMIGCGGGNPVRATPVDRADYEHWHTGPSDNSYAATEVFELPASLPEGSYSARLFANGRAFNPAGYDAGPGSDWHYDHVYSRSHPRRDISVVRE